MKITKPGVYPDCSEEDYAADPCETPSLRASDLKTILRKTPRHAWAANPRLNPKHRPEHKQAFDIGRVAHAMILGDEDQFVIVDADSWQTKAARKERDDARASGLTPVLVDQYENLVDMAEAVRQQIAEAGIDLFAGLAEQTIVWEAEGGVLCRCRPDWISPDLVLDLKSTSAESTPESWGWSVAWNTGCHLQQAHYVDGIRAITGRATRFKFLVFEVEPPYSASLIEIAEESMVTAEEMRAVGLRIWADCLRSGIWPRSDMTTRRIHMPARLRMQWEERMANEELPDEHHLRAG